MKNNWNSMMDDVVDIQRASVAVDISTIRDRRVTSYTTLSSSVRCYKEDGPVSYEFNDQLGQVPVRTWTFYFNADVTIAEGDRLKQGSTYFLVKEVSDYSRLGFGIQIRAVEKVFAMQ